MKHVSLMKSNDLFRSIKTPNDIHRLKTEELKLLAKEVRQEIINIVSKSEGHLGASLGTVELTVALYSRFDLKKDRVVWDVGHQAYAHKILSGRRDKFHTNRKWEGISGFPVIEESEYDAFGTGHSSTSISACTGIAYAFRLQKKDNYSIAIIGDSAIANGVAFEGLNHAGALDINLIIVLNDNNIGIDPSVGALKNHFKKISKGLDDDENIFENLGFTYHFIADGHSIEDLTSIFDKVKKEKGKHLIHISTIKGKGIKEAERDQIKWHYPGKFDSLLSKLIETKENAFTKYQDVFGYSMLEISDTNDKIVGITPAMPTGSSLSYMIKKYPDKALDVGISESHALIFAGGLATQGFVPYVSIYSTFLQRAYDQLVHDIAIQNLPVVICVDRSGLVGHDGATHQGVLDISFCRAIPNLTIVNPQNEVELRNSLFSAQKIKSPLLIRYPRGYGKMLDWKKEFEEIKFENKAFALAKSDKCIVTTGAWSSEIKSVADKLGLDFHVLFCLKPIDKKTIEDIAKYEKVMFLEECYEIGGIGEYLAKQLLEIGFRGKYKHIGIPDSFVPHGKVEQQREFCKIDIKSIEISAISFFNV